MDWYTFCNDLTLLPPSEVRWEVFLPSGGSDKILSACFAALAHARRVISLLPAEETQIMERFLYRSCNQHRNNAYFRTLKQILRLLVNCDEQSLTSSLNDVYCTIKNSKKQFGKGDPGVIAVPSREAIECIALRFVSVMGLCRRIELLCEKAWLPLQGLLGQTYFMPFALTAMAIVARIATKVKTMQTKGKESWSLLLATRCRCDDPPSEIFVAESPFSTVHPWETELQEILKKCFENFEVGSQRTSSVILDFDAAAAIAKKSQPPVVTNDTLDKRKFNLPHHLSTLTGAELSEVVPETGSDMVPGLKFAQQHTKTVKTLVPELSLGDMHHNEDALGVKRKRGGKDQNRSKSPRPPKRAVHDSKHKETYRLVAIEPEMSKKAKKEKHKSKKKLERVTPKPTGKKRSMADIMKTLLGGNR